MFELELVLINLLGNLGNTLLNLYLDEIIFQTKVAKNKGVRSLKLRTAPHPTLRHRLLGTFVRAPN